jgi:ribosomal protein S18 acetylase RimI-like enzyme
VVLIRPGTRVDAEPAIAVWRAAYEATRGGAGAADPHTQRVRDFLGEPDAFLVVADDELDIVGMGVGTQGLADGGAGSPVPGLLHISMLFVHPRRWGHGLGGTLLDTVLDEGRLRAYERAEIWAHLDNTRAQHLYESHGFEPTERQRPDLAGDLITEYRRVL